MKKIYLLLLGILFTALVYIPSLAEASEVFQDADYEKSNTPVVDLSEDTTIYEVEAEDETTPRYGPTVIIRHGLIYQINIGELRKLL